MTAAKRETASEMMDRMIAKKVKEDLAVKVTPAEVAKEALFLQGWAKSARISKLSPESTFYTKGKLMVKLYPAMVEALLRDGHAVGTERAFVMVKPAKATKTEA